MAKIPYIRGIRPGIPTPEELRERIPGWGVDLDPADRPSYPRELADGVPDGILWDFPEEQPDTSPPRERSIEHARLTPVFGTVAPLHGVPGAVRRFAYAKFSEARAAHWLLLLAADRIESKQALWQSFSTDRPDSFVEETGIRAERSHHGLRSRWGRGRVDKHQAMDPVVLALPALLGGWAVTRVVRRLVRS
ncbi:hypothetical protein [Aeromicrobium duanguangcaii]|uniref:Uncharacterized protein n=1 Tax=Aeromicrobium duanguangcaii TaxID=2968086 RepID=A0ABY5KDD9_9ACTN|nr:hypothetical protein [Aeromicrobium duanguangcaii]MCD9154797.1 hypothetical protein [Aeromicrobium duanguangcaii]UUI67788.1 hypothetical protein NP095_11345 [Aeromicrobium duanguangcaii]